MLKCVVKERRCEEASWKMFTQLYGEVQGWEQDTTKDTFKLDFLPESGAETATLTDGQICMNLKLFKMVFNRALRIKSRDHERGEQMFKYLLGKLEQMLGNANTYYASSLYFELVRTSNSLSQNEKSLEYLNMGGKILLEHYGGEDAANYIDFHLRKIELLVNLVLDHNSAVKNQGIEEEKQAYPIEDVKRDLAEANDAFIALAKKVNAPIAPASKTEKSTSEILQLSDLQNTGSEFVIESLLMKC